LEKRKSTGRVHYEASIKMLYFPGNNHSQV